MSRSHSLVLALTLVAASRVVAQPPAPRVVGPGGPGAQLQVGTGAYQGATPAVRGDNPFAAPAALPNIPPGMRFAPRPSAPPVVFAPPVPGVPNNPAMFNPGVPPPFPVLVPPIPVVNGVTYNPLFVSRRGVVSAYYVPPTTVRYPNLESDPADDELIPVAPEAWSGLGSAPGEYRFLPWIW